MQLKALYSKYISNYMNLTVLCRQQSYEVMNYPLKYNIHKIYVNCDNVKENQIK
jgi:hypothetical protein